MKRWEYECLNRSHYWDEADMNEFGAEGWELVSASSVWPFGSEFIVCLFKREL